LRYTFSFNHFNHINIDIKLSCPYIFLSQQLGHFFLVHLDDLLHLEANICFHFLVPDSWSEAKYLTLRVIEITYAGMEQDIRQIIADMIKAGTKVIMTGHWPLDYITNNNWQKKSKNTTRNYQKYAIATYLEKTLLPTYHEKLLEQSVAAADLCQDLHDLVFKHAKKKAIIVPSLKKPETIKHYNFLDGLGVLPNVSENRDDLGDTMIELSLSGSEVKHKHMIKKLMKAILKLPSALLVP
jgi:hypothetical protein